MEKDDAGAGDEGELSAADKTITMLKVLKKGASGELVVQWQRFLRGQGYALNQSGHFDDATFAATVAFQKKHKLDVDGAVGNQTFGKAAMLGFELVDFVGSLDTYPKKPDFPPLVTNDQRQALFGPLEFVPAPTAKEPEKIRITNKWDRNNLVKVAIPQLVGVKGAAADGSIWFHRKVAGQLSQLWDAWEAAGLLDRVHTYDGAYNPRFVRGKAHEQVLSNHAFAMGFDINCARNKLGAQPAPFGSKGCVYELVPIAHQHGFYWGGHFTRRDGMHFEIARMI